MSSNDKNNILHKAGNVWLIQQPFNKRRQDGSVAVNLCVKLDSGALATVEMLNLRPDGVFCRGDAIIGLIDSEEFRQYINNFQNSNALFPVGISSNSDSDLFQLAPAAYSKTKSIKKTAESLGISKEKARRILFATGDYTCANHEKVMLLLKEGKSLDEIASSTGFTRKIVNTYLPYDIPANSTQD